MAAARRAAVLESVVQAWADQVSQPGDLPIAPEPIDGHECQELTHSEQLVSVAPASTAARS